MDEILAGESGSESNCSGPETYYDENVVVSQSLLNSIVPDSLLDYDNEVEILGGDLSKTNNDSPSPSSSQQSKPPKRKAAKRTGTVSTSTNQLLTKKYRQTTIGASGRLDLSSEANNEEPLTNDGIARKLFTKSIELNKYFKYFEQSGGAGHFECLVKDPETSAICGKHLRRVQSGFYNLKIHLKTIHKIELQVVDNSEDPKISDLMPSKNSYSSYHPKQKKFEESIVDMICVGSHKLDLLHDVTFLRLVGMLDPKIKPLSRRTTIRRILETSEVVKRTIKEEISTLEKRGVHVSCDIWTSRRRTGILGIVIHYIDEKWKLKENLIGFKILDSAHTGENIRLKFLEVVEEFGLSNEKDKIGFVTSDNASNMIAAFNILKVSYETNDPDFDLLEQIEREINKESLQPTAIGDDQNLLLDFDSDRISGEEINQDVMSIVSEDSSIDTGWTSIIGWIGCNAHTLQLVINNAISKHQSVEELISYVHSIMKFFKKSCKWTDELKRLTSVDVVMPGKTRWNSTLDMLKRFLNDEFYNALRTVLEKAQVAKIKNVPRSPTLSDKMNAKELYDLLKPLGIATDYLQGSGSLAGTFLLTMVHCYERFTKVPCKTYMLFQLDLRSDFIAKFAAPLRSEHWILASFLDPRVKLSVVQAIHAGECGKHWLFPALENVKDIITSTVYVRMTAAEYRTNPDMPDEVETTEDHESNMFDLIKPHCRPLGKEAEEFTAYSQESTLKPTECPLKYWEQNSNRFPVLAALAKTFLAIPVTSGTIERVYSIAGNYLRATRSRTTPENTEAMLLVRQYRKPKCLEPFLKA